MTIKPTNYNLTFEPDLEKFTFKGKEILTFEVKDHAREIILDAVDLDVRSVILAKGARLPLGASAKWGPESWLDSEVIRKNSPQNDKRVSFRLDHKNEKLIIQLSEKLKAGQHKLNIEFEGILNDKLTGFYRSRYLTEGKEKVMATTQFEAADARRGFPCIDNPSYKATFDVSLIVDKDLTAISNTLPIINRHSGKRGTSASRIVVQNKDSGQAGMTASKVKKIVRFEQTPLMSTYLLYLGVGEFEWIEDKFKDVLLRVITTPGKKHYGKFALECAKKSLEYFEKYFNYHYPLKKLDLIAITEFASGAMENWGAITFRENSLLYYPEKSSKATKQRIAEVIAHEIAHQWFGNLVTMKWWDDLWLNESFATYMAHKVLNHYWPEWEVWSQYVTDTVFEGMALDSLKSSHPIKVKVNKISEIDELFDEIAYEKGGSILRMLDLYLGEEVFMNGLRKYIKKYQYKNAEAQDLWNSLENTAEKPVVKIMQSYVNQVGFPQIKAELKRNTIKLEQSRFLLEQNKTDLKKEWLIPYHLDHDRVIDDTYLLDKKVREIKIGKDFKYLSLNKNYSSFFISDYSDELLEKLGENLNLLNNQEKIGVIHDLFALILAGKKDLKKLFYYINSFFPEEKSSIVLHYIISKLTGIFLLLQDNESKNLAAKFAKKALDKVGYEPKKEESVLDSYLRASALSSLSLFNDNEVKVFIKNKFIKYLENEKSLHPDLRMVVYSSALWFDKRNYNVLRKEYEESQIQEEKAKFLSALGFIKNKEHIKNTLTYIMTPKVPLAFLLYGISSIARNPYARDIALDWLILIWPVLVKRSAGLATMLLRRVLQAIIPICGIGREKEVTEFFTMNKPAGLERSIDQVLEMMRINSRFVKKLKSFQ
ncbi:hypothetical protein A2767_01500 [Candidatus Roizmanbacteria bacterium RIFCSPHIGHO2_01_FULL_35_10]|nr:MAG: hypothetical protein A2767_01500 [Candidatus Roizmanbacteria bacterium RIFCSPHIGHO2_01_FULL_35_10]